MGLSSLDALGVVSLTASGASGDDLFIVCMNACTCIYHVFLWYTRVCTPLHCIDMYLFMIVCIYRYFIYVPRRQAIAVATVWLPATLGVVIRPVPLIKPQSSRYGRLMSVAMSMYPLQAHNAMMTR